MPTASPPPPDYDDAAIERVARGLLDCSLPAAEWTHAAHFAAALWLLKHRPEAATPEAMREAISRYNEACGKENTDSAGYHHTITMASLGAARHHLDSNADLPLQSVFERVMLSPQARSDWLFTYWTAEILFAPEARRAWCPPNLAPLPFPVNS